MRRLVISLVQSINGSYAQDDWSSGVSTPADFEYFKSLRRRADAIIIDRRTALNPLLPVINAAGKALETTPVHVLTESDPQALAGELRGLGLDYRAQHFTPATVTEVLNSIETRVDTTVETKPEASASEATLLCESGPNLAYRLLDAYPGAELHLSLTPRYSRNAGSHFCRLDAEIDLRIIDVRTEDEQIFVRYAKT